MSESAPNDDIFNIPRLWSPEAHGSRCFYYDVFVSHASGDGSECLVRELRARHLRVWYDTGQVMNDQMWTTRICWGLRASRSILVVIGKIPLEEYGWVWTEALAARAP